MANKASPNSTGWPLETNFFSMTPAISASISFINFIDSMMQRTCPAVTLSPVSTNAGASGGEEAS